jgi:DNA-binding CsgD family transcriptional regulator
MLGRKLPCRVKGSAMLIENGHLLESAIHHLPFGIMVVDAHRKVLATNRAAKDILQTRDALVERQSVLRAYQREDDERLTQVLAEATAVRSNPPWSGCIRLSRRSGRPAYTAIVSTLFDAVDGRSTVGSRAALITITDPDREHSSGLAKMLQQAFGLTPAEAQTASLMGSGLSPQDTADQLGLTVGTIRCELKAIFAKVGISRQSELASTVTRLALLIPNCGDYQGSCINSVYLDEKFLGDPEVSSFSGPIRAQERRWCMDTPTY